MAKFFSLTFKRPRTPIPCGSGFRVTHALRFDERGNKYLAEVGSFDQYAYIQSFAESTDINEIIRRSTPEQMASYAGGIYADVSAMPETLADSYAVLKNAEFIYDSLDADAKAKYGNYREFLNSFGTMQGVVDFVANCTTASASDHASDAAKSINEEVTTNES